MVSAVNYKYNYVDKVKKLVPAFYIDEDLKNGREEDILYKVFGKSLLAGKENATFFSVSGYSQDNIQQFFIPSNRLTDVTPQVFQEHVLKRYGRTFSDFKNIDDFNTFLSGTVQPDIILNELGSAFTSSAINEYYSTLNSVNDVHEDLVSSLGLMYFLNTSGVTGTSNTLSSILTTYISSSVYYGKTFTEQEGVNCLFDYIWGGREESAVLNRYLPFEFQTTSAVLSTGVYTSGTQYLDNLKTLLGIWYNPRERESTFIETSYETLNASGLIESKFESAGPLMTFLKAISYAFYDLDILIEDIASLLSIDDCPPEFLDYLSGLVGWKLVGGDIDSWRAQLRQAVYVYKSKGTRQGLVDALQYVFPREITTFDASSDIKESFESYLPNLIYYALKTESEVCQSYNSLAAFIQNSRQTSDVVYNLSPDNHDKNIRFMVDAILEELDNEFKFIKINGVHYKETPYYTSQPLQDGGWIKEGSSVQGKGYSHRGGFMVAVPPWENTRFYATTIITSKLLDRLREILSECNEGSRFGISEEFLDDMITYIKDSVGIDTEEENFYFGNNNRFKFFTSSLEYAPNFSTVIENNIPDQVQSLDYWNTKSSHIFVSIEAGDLNESNGLDSLTPSVISNISKTLIEFTPFHAVTRMYIGIEVTDEITDAVDSVVFNIRGSFEDANTNVLDSTEVSGWIGTSGVGDYFSSIDSSLLQDGRALPLPSDTFWGVYSGNIERDASRRRDFKYEIIGQRYTRNGINQPISTYFYGSSLSSLETTKELIYKGFNFSGQHFISPSSINYSGVYSKVNSPVVKDNAILYSAPSGEVIGLPISSTINIRGVQDEGLQFVPEDRTLPGGIYKTLVNRLLRLGEKDSRYLDFDIKKMQESELGSGIHDLWNDNKDLFESNLDGSGFYSLYHAFGPLVFNSNMSFSGVVGNTTTSSLTAYRDGTSTNLSHPQFRYIVGSNSIKDEAYRTHDDQLSLVANPGLAWEKGWNSYIHELDSHPKYTNRNQVSSVELSFVENDDTIAIVNYPTIVDEGCSKRRLVDKQGITFFSGRNVLQGNERPTLRFPLTRNKNYISDYVFKETSNWIVSGGELVSFSSDEGTVPSSLQFSSGFNVFEFSGNSFLSAISDEFIRTDSLVNLRPTDKYTLTYQTSGSNTDGVLGWILANTTKSKAFDLDSNSWVSSRAVNNSSPSADASWKTVTSEILVDSSFDVDDKYILLFGLESSATSAARVRSPKFREYDGNTLFPGREYSGSILVDSSGFGNTNKVKVSIKTGLKKHEGLESVSDYFVYDFRRNRWQLKEEAFEDAGIFELVDGMNSINFNFHTDNLRGPLDLGVRKLRTGERYQYVHSDDTYYYIEITPILEAHTESSDLLKPSVRIEFAGIKDRRYIEVPEEYTRYEAKLVIDFLSTLTTTLHSRNKDITEPLGLGENGGSRLVYMERYGGSNIESDDGGVTYYNI